MNVQKRRTTIRKLRELADELIRAHNYHNIQRIDHISNTTLLKEFLGAAKRAIEQDIKETSDVAFKLSLGMNTINSCEIYNLIQSYPGYAKTLRDLANDLQNDL